MSCGSFLVVFVSRELVLSTSSFSRRVTKTKIMKHQSFYPSVVMIVMFLYGSRYLLPVHEMAPIAGGFFKSIPDRFLQIHLILVWKNIELKLRSGACLVVFRAKSARMLDVLSRKITRFRKCTASVKFKPCQKDGRQTCHDQWADKRIPQKPIFDEDGWVNHISNKLTCIQLNRNL